MKEFMAELEKNFNNFIEEVKKLEEQILEGLKKKRTPEVGEVADIAGMKWRILDKTEEGYLAITEDFISASMKFDTDANNWEESALREYLHTEILQKIESEIGENALQEFERDLTSLDGQTEYGTCVDKVSMLTVDEYRKYRKHLPNTKKWWWLITPWSTPCNEIDYSVTVVSPGGRIDFDGFNCDGGVRPVCIFKSSIFGSGEE